MGNEQLSDLARYTKAMIAGNIGVCIAIEQRHNLYGYPPEIVGMGLKAIEDGRDPDAVIGAYVSGEDDQP